jgi:hypothetical protein
LQPTPSVISDYSNQNQHRRLWFTDIDISVWFSGPVFLRSRSKKTKWGKSLRILYTFRKCTKSDAFTATNYNAVLLRRFDTEWKSDVSEAVSITRGRCDEWHKLVYRIYMYTYRNPLFSQNWPTKEKWKRQGIIYHITMNNDG